MSNQFAALNVTVDSVSGVRNVKKCCGDNQRSSAVASYPPKLIIDLKRFIPVRNRKWTTVFGKEVSKRTHADTGNEDPVNPAYCDRSKGIVASCISEVSESAGEFQLCGDTAICCRHEGKTEAVPSRSRKETNKQRLSRTAESRGLATDSTSLTIRGETEPGTSHCYNKTDSCTNGVRGCKNNCGIDDPFANVPELTASQEKPVSPRFGQHAQSRGGEPEERLTCICNRPARSVLCRSCGQSRRGRARRACPVHPKRMDLMDFRQCWKCFSSNIVESD